MEKRSMKDGGEKLCGSIRRFDRQRSSIGRHYGSKRTLGARCIKDRTDAGKFV